MATNSSSGSSLPITRITPVRAAERTPATLTAVRKPSETTMISTRPRSCPAHGQNRATASANALLNAAAELIRVSQIIQPISKPAKRPNASRA
ncbi:hypothetical protein D3C71_1292070 [compost metagenome]